MHRRWRVQCLVGGKEVDQSKGLRDELAAAAVRKANRQAPTRPPMTWCMAVG